MVIGERTQFQFIELYNTTAADVDVTDWTLVFSLDRPTDAKIDVDQVSSQPPFSLGVNFLDVGKSGRVTNTKAKDTDGYDFRLPGLSPCSGRSLTTKLRR